MKLALIISAAALALCASSSAKADTAQFNVGVSSSTACGAAQIGPCGKASGSSPPYGSCTASQTFFGRSDTVTNLAAAVSGSAPGISTWKTAVDTLICGQVSGGTWTLKDVEYVLTAPTAALANENLVSASYTLTQEAGMTFTANAGITGAITATGYSDTGYTPSSGSMTSSSASYGVCLLNSRTVLSPNTTFSSQLGTQSSGNDFGLDILTQSSAAGTLTIVGGTTAYSTTTGLIPNTLGGIFVSRMSTTAYTTYHNGSSINTLTATMTTTAGPTDFYLLGMNNAGSLLNSKGVADTMGLAVLGAGETTTQIEADETLYGAALTSITGASKTC